MSEEGFRVILSVFSQQRVDVHVFELEGSCVTAPRGQSQKQAKRLKVGHPPAKCATQQLHLEHHKVSRKSSVLQDGSGKQTTN